jgi:hypothetical protein
VEGEPLHANNGPAAAAFVRPEFGVFLLQSRQNLQRQSPGVAPN